MKKVGRIVGLSPEKEDGGKGVKERYFKKRRGGQRKKRKTVNWKNRPLTKKNERKVT